MTHPSTAVIYAYGADGPDWGGRAQQIQRCQAYAARQQLPVLEVVSEAKWAGPALSRPAFGPLFSAIVTMPAPPAYLLVTTVDRIGRRTDLEEGAYLAWRLRQAGVHLIDIDVADGQHLPPSDPIERTMRCIRLAMEQEYRREEERHQIQFASRVQLYCHFLTHGGWPAVHAVDGAAGFGYRRWRQVTPGYYQPAPDDLPTGEGILLPGPAEELHSFKCVYSLIRQCTSSSEPLVPQLHQHLGKDWTPARAVAVMADATLSRIGIPGWELLSPEQHALMVEWLQAWVTGPDVEEIAGDTA